MTQWDNDTDKAFSQTADKWTQNWTHELTLKGEFA